MVPGNTPSMRHSSELLRAETNFLLSHHSSTINTTPPNGLYTQYTVTASALRAAKYMQCYKFILYIARNHRTLDHQKVVEQIHSRTLKHTRKTIKKIFKDLWDSPMPLKHFIKARYDEKQKAFLAFTAKYPTFQKWGEQYGFQDRSREAYHTQAKEPLFTQLIDDILPPDYPNKPEAPRIIRATMLILLGLPNANWRDRKKEGCPLCLLPFSHGGYHILYKCTATETYHPRQRKRENNNLNDAEEMLKDHCKLAPNEICPLYTPIDVWNLAKLAIKIRPDIWSYKERDQDPTTIQWGEANLTEMQNQLERDFEEAVSGKP